MFLRRIFLENITQLKTFRTQMLYCLCAPTLMRQVGLIPLQGSESGITGMVTEEQSVLGGTAPRKYGSHLFY